MKTSFQPTLMLIAGRTLAFTVSFFIPVVLVRVFDQAMFGTYKQVFLIYGILYGITQIGMAESLYYFIPQRTADGGRFVMNSVVTMGVSGLVCLGALAAFSSNIARWLGNPEAAAYVVPIGIFLLLMLMTASLEISMIARNQCRRAAYVYAFSDLVRSLFLIVPVLLLKNLEWLLAGAIAFGAIRLFYTLWYLRREFGQELTFDWPCLRRQFVYVLPFEMAIIVEILQANYHQYAVSSHFGVVVFAIYSVGCLQLPFVDFVAGPACNVMMVRMAEEIREGRNKSVLAIWHDTTRKLGLIFIPLFVLLVISAREIILVLFTDRYAAAIPIFMLSAAVVLFAVFQTDGLLRVYAQMRYTLFLNIVRLGVIAGMIGWFLSIFELPGAILITLLATVISKSLAIVRAKRLMQVSAARILPWGSLAAIGAASAAAALPAWMVKTQVHLPLIPLLMLTGTAFAFSYAGLVLGFGLLSEGEKLAVTGWLRRPALVKTREVEGS